MNDEKLIVGLKTYFGLSGVFGIMLLWTHGRQLREKYQNLPYGHRVNAIIDELNMKFFYGGLLWPLFLTSGIFTFIVAI